MHKFKLENLILMALIVSFITAAMPVYADEASLSTQEDTTLEGATQEDTTQEDTTQEDTTKEDSTQVDAVEYYTVAVSDEEGSASETVIISKTSIEYGLGKMITDKVVAPEGKEFGGYYLGDTQLYTYTWGGKYNTSVPIDTDRDTKETINVSIKYVDETYIIKDEVKSFSSDKVTVVED